MELTYAQNFENAQHKLASLEGVSVDQCVCYRTKYTAVVSGRYIKYVMAVVHELEAIGFCVVGQIMPIWIRNSELGEMTYTATLINRTRA